MRTIYWRVETPAGSSRGEFGEVKTLRGATARLRRWYPDCTHIVVSFDSAALDSK